MTTRVETLFEVSERVQKDGPSAPLNLVLEIMLSWSLSAQSYPFQVRVVDTNDHGDFFEGIFICKDEFTLELRGAYTYFLEEDKRYLRIVHFEVIKIDTLVKILRTYESKFRQETLFQGALISLVEHCRKSPEVIPLLVSDTFKVPCSDFDKHLDQIEEKADQLGFVDLRAWRP